jgi:serine/threonine protein kinase
MQSTIFIPPRPLLEWYTPKNKTLGQGSFGKLELASDDREILHSWRLNNRDDEMPFTYDLHGETPDIPGEELREMPLTVIKGYFAQYTLEAIIKSTPSYIMQSDLSNATKQEAAKEILKLHQKNKLSRYRLILALSAIIAPLKVERGATAAAAEEPLEKRPLVAIKQSLMSKDANRHLEYYEGVAKTEVFTLGQVSSAAPLLIQNVDGTIIQEDAVGCTTFLNQVVVVCMKDYFFDTMTTTYNIVLEYIQGLTLYEMMEGLSLNTLDMCGPLPFRGTFIWYVAYSMLHALQMCHDMYIIHNDVKLENIMFDRNSKRIVLLDLGLACHAAVGEGEVIDSCDKMGGTPDYISPEQVFYQKRYYASDVWALGVVLWEMAIGNSYNVPGDDVTSKVESMRRGFRPELKAIKPYFMWHYEDFISLLDLMFQPDPADRITTQEGIEFIRQALHRYDDPNDNGEHLGNWLQEYCCGKSILDTVAPIQTTTLKTPPSSPREQQMPPFMTP